jgi:hypothetical protein
MDFQLPHLKNLLDAWMETPPPELRAEAHNLKFDEHGTPDRIHAFENFSKPAATIGALRRELVRFYQLYVRTEAGLPQTFGPLNAASGLKNISEEQLLVRLEDLREPLARIGTTFENIDEALKRADVAPLKYFLDQWGTRPDILRNPCSFAAFKDELLDELARPDWPEALRDKLGLGHYDPSPDAIPVALMEYPVSQVFKQYSKANITAHFAIPSAFDTSQNAQFFPTCTELKFGCPMSLKPVVSDEDLIAEVVHPKVQYKPSNLKRVGFIKARPPSHPISEVRNLHLLALRIASGRSNFGVEM